MAKFLQWLQARRLRNLRLQLAQVEAAIASDERVQRVTGVVYPTKAAASAMKLARIKFEIAEIDPPRR
jgi:hypothetical protein